MYTTPVVGFTLNGKELEPRKSIVFVACTSRSAAVILRGFVEPASHTEVLITGGP